MAGQQHADGLTALDARTRDDRRLDRLEARHEPADVLDRDDGSARDRSGEAHDAAVRRDHHRPRGCRDVDAPVARAVS
ncbi:hypothetical protein ABIB37_002081 [Agrococcus sp. UYP10]